MKRTLGADMPGLWKIIHRECGWPTGTMTNMGFMIGDPRSGHSEKRCEHCEKLLHADNVQLVRTDEA